MRSMKVEFSSLSVYPNAFLLKDLVDDLVFSTLIGNVFTQSNPEDSGRLSRSNPRGMQAFQAVCRESYFLSNRRAFVLIAWTSTFELMIPTSLRRSQVRAVRNRISMVTARTFPFALFDFLK